MKPGAHRLIRAASALASVLLLDTFARAAEPSNAAASAATAKGTEMLQVVEVVEVAKDRAYLSPGIERELEAAPQVTIGRHRYRVLASNTKNIVIARGGR